MKIVIPLGEYYLIAPSPAPEKSEGGIFIPSSAKSSTVVEGQVVESSEEVPNLTGKKVLVRFITCPVESHGTNMFLVKKDDVVGVVHE